jgi:predicted nucleic acid-binding protein
MNDDILVDSAVYIDLLRAGVNVHRRLISHLRAGCLYNCGIVRAEVLRGVKAPDKRDEMEAFFDIIPEVPTDARLWHYVSHLGWELGRRGKWPPVTDLAIAACALRIGARLISPDAHFTDIPGLTVLPAIPE